MSPFTPSTSSRTSQEQLNPHLSTGELIRAGLEDPEAGATTAEYGIVMMAAVGFAGLLVVILKSEEVRQMLLGIVQAALSTGA